MAGPVGLKHVVDMARNSGMLSMPLDEVLSHQRISPKSMNTNPFLLEVQDPPMEPFLRQTADPLPVVHEGQPRLQSEPQVFEEDPEEEAFRAVFNTGVEKGGVEWPQGRVAHSGPLPSTSSLLEDLERQSSSKKHSQSKDDALNALHIEACEGNVESLRARLAAGDNVNRYHPKMGGTPLHYAAEYGRLEAVKFLLDSGAEIEMKEVVGRTALHLAARNGHSEVVKVLLDRGADIEAKNIFLQTPLHLAAERGKADVCTLLASRGANLEAQDKVGRTPLHDACREGKQTIVDALIRKGANLNARDHEQATPLQWAAAKGHSRVVLLLMKNGAETDVSDAGGRTPQHDAAANGHATMVEILLKHSLRVDPRDQDGRTPLHHAAENGRTVAAQVLLKYGASLDPRDHAGRTPLEFANDYGRACTMELLTQAQGEEQPDKICCTIL